jgi:hypothetical protein
MPAGFFELTGKTNLLISMDRKIPVSEFKGAIAHCLLKSGVSRSYRYLNAYELIDIYLGNHPDYRALLSISADIVVIDYGFDEFENKRQEDALNQVISNQIRRKKLVWIFSYGMFPLSRVTDLCKKSENFNILEY